MGANIKSKILLIALCILSALLLHYQPVTAASTGEMPIQNTNSVKETITVTPEITYIRVKGAVPVLAEAHSKADAIGLLQKGQMAISTGKTSHGWKQVYYIGKIGYIQDDKAENYLGSVIPMPKWKLDFTKKRVKINILGDSITYGDKLSSQEKAYPTRLVTMLDAEACNNYGWNGSAIAGTHPDRFVDRYASMDADANLILVFGGTNDYGCLGDEYGTELGKMGDVTDTTFYGGLNQLMCGLKQKYPDSEIVFLTPLTRKNAMRKNQFGYTLPDYVNAIKEMAQFYKIRVVDLYAEETLDFSGKYAGYLVDGLHPNAAGHRMIADYLTDILKMW